MHVINSLDEIKKYKKKILKAEIVNSETLSMLEYLENNLIEIKKHSQSLENRCKTYRDAIESCGFTRNKVKRNLNLRFGNK